MVDAVGDAVEVEAEETEAEESDRVEVGLEVEAEVFLTREEGVTEPGAVFLFVVCEGVSVVTAELCCCFEIISFCFCFDDSCSSCFCSCCCR